MSTAPDSPDRNGRPAASGRGDRRRSRPGRLVALAAAGLLLLATAVVGGPFLYARFLAPEPPPPLSIADAAHSEDVAGDGPAEGRVDLDGTWEVGEGSEAGYRLDEVLSGQPVTVVGRTGEVTGTLTVQDGTLVAADIVVDVASIATDEPARDSYFRRALRVGALPEATFTLTEPVDLGELTEEGTLTVDAVGELILHGVTRPAVVALDARRTADGVSVVGSIPVVLSDHDLAAPGLGFVVVEPEGLVEMRLLLRR